MKLVTNTTLTLTFGGLGADSLQKNKRRKLVTTGGWNQLSGLILHIVLHTPFYITSYIHYCLSAKLFSKKYESVEQFTEKHHRVYSYI